jgi:hypothetical protein
MLGREGVSTDARVRGLAWKDLAGLNTIERIRELVLPLPSLLVALMAAAYGLWIVAFPASFYFFLERTSTGPRHVPWESRPASIGE